MKSCLKILAFPCFLLGVITFVVPGEHDGKALFKSKKCNMCHSVSTQGITAKTKNENLKGPDLVGLAGKYDSAWISRYLKKEVDKDGKSHKTPFKGTDEELPALVDWLLEQKN